MDFFRDAEDRPSRPSHLFLEHGIINLITEGGGHGIYICDVAIGRDLGPIYHTATETTEKNRGVLHQPLAHVIADNGLAVRVQRQPQITVAMPG